MQMQCAAADQSDGRDAVESCKPLRMGDVARTTAKATSRIRKRPLPQNLVRIHVMTQTGCPSSSFSVQAPNRARPRVREPGSPLNLSSLQILHSIHLDTLSQPRRPLSRSAKWRSPRAQFADPLTTPSEPCCSSMCHGKSFCCQSHSLVLAMATIRPPPCSCHSTTLLLCASLAGTPSTLLHPPSASIFTSRTGPLAGCSQGSFPSSPTVRRCGLSRSRGSTC